MSEQNIHQAINVYLRLALPPDAWAAALDSAGKASFVVAAKLKARGGVKGTPDHLVLWNGRAVFLEVKTDKGRVSDAQEAVRAEIVRAGGEWACVRSVTDAEAVLRQFGVPLRATTMTAQERDQRLADRSTGTPRKASRPRAAKPTLAQVRRTNAVRARVMF